jgi:inner membrane protein
MPSPIVHLAAGYAVYRTVTHVNATPRPDVVVLGAALGLSLLPDLDSVLGILLGDFGRYHNSQSHSLILGAVVAVLAGLIAAAAGLRRPVLWFGLTLACYELHIVLDYFTWGRGVMAWWPLTPERFSSPVRLFYGLHWSEGFVSVRHLVTLATEVPVAALTLFVARAATRRTADAPAPPTAG